MPGTRCDARTDASKQGAKSVPGAWCDARSSYVSQGQSPSFSSTWCNRKHAYRVSKRGGRFAGSLNEARWFYAPTGRKGIAQGKAKRRPGVRDVINIASPERAEPNSA